MALDPFFGSVLAAGANIAGGLVGGESSRKANENATDVANANMQRQWQLATSGVTIKANDIMRAYQETGIHPLALLGTQGPTYSPVSAAFTTSPMGEAIGKAGQDISRGMYATADNELRGKAFALQEQVLKNNVERGQLENFILKQKIASDTARLTNVTAPPAASPTNSSLVPGQTNSIDTTRLLSDPVLPNFRTADIPEMRYVKTSEGGLQPTMAKDFQESSEDSFLQKLPFYMRQYVRPFLFQGTPPAESAGPGRVWVWDPIGFQWKSRSSSDWDVFSFGPSRPARIPVTDRRYNYGGTR